jgi:hypothetical protein
MGEEFVDVFYESEVSVRVREYLKERDIKELKKTCTDVELGIRVQEQYPNFRLLLPQTRYYLNRHPQNSLHPLTQPEQEPEPEP